MRPWATVLVAWAAAALVSLPQRGAMAQPTVSDPSSHSKRMADLEAEEKEADKLQREAELEIARLEAEVRSSRKAQR